MGRSPCCDKTAVKRGPWSEEEDARLRSYIERHGGAVAGGWMALPRRAGLRRCGKSCRLRWLNYLRPGVRHGGFSPEEDSVICALYAAVGSRWSLIAAHLPGRTDNAVKNYWNTRLKKKLALLLASCQNDDRISCGSAAAPQPVIMPPPPLLPPPPPPYSTGLPYGYGGAGVDHNHMHTGGGGGTATGGMFATSSSCEPAAATELDEIFRSMVGTTAAGEHHSDLSRQSATEIETSWYHCQRGESVLHQHLEYY
ncbi:hypothetical protein BS78_08G166800 [Paspalum vaginatum]|nr:hypothetical protein BS78_08G166800 [Paspalum vaginatum]